MYSSSLSTPTLPPGVMSLAADNARQDNAAGAGLLNVANNSSDLRPQGVTGLQSPATEVLAASPGAAVVQMAVLTSAGKMDREIGHAIRDWAPEWLGRINARQDTPVESIGSLWNAWADGTGHPMAAIATQELVSAGLSLADGQTPDDFAFGLRQLAKTYPIHQ